MRRGYKARSWTRMHPPDPIRTMRGYGQLPPIDSTVLPELPGYVTQDKCDASIRATVATEQKKRNTWAAAGAIGGLLLGLMFGRVTK